MRFVALLLLPCVLLVFGQEASRSGKERAKPTPLYDRILELDRIYFEAYNRCDLETQEALYAEDLEFFHDEGA